MNKKEVLEIKKLYAPNNCSVRKLVGCYVDADKNIKAKFNNVFLNMREEEQFKYFEILKKGLSGTVGKNIRTFIFTNDNKVKQSLLGLLHSDLQEEEILDAFYQKIIESYNIVENYAIILINNVYDVIHKGGDGFNQQDSDETYSYLSCYICPVKLESPGLSFDSDGNAFVSKDRRWCMEAPICNFLYPSFEDRSMDTDNITVYTKKTDNTYSNFINQVLEFDTKLSPEEQKQEFQKIVENVIQDNPDKMDVVKSIYENINSKIEDSPTMVELDKTEIRNILSDSGVNENAMQQFETAYEDAFGNEPVSVKSIVNTKELQIKSPDVIIKVKPDKADIVRTREIDGLKCLVISIGSNSDVEINGINL